MAKKPTKQTKAALAALVIASAAMTSIPVSPAFAEEQQTITRDVSGFNTIRLSGKFHGSVVVGKSEGLTLTGDGNLEERFVAEVHGDELRVKLTRQGRRGDTIQLAISARELEEFVVEGTGTFDIKGVNSEDFDIKLPGSSSIDVSGKCGSIGIKISGKGNVSAENLKCSHGQVKISGVGTVSLHAADSIDARVSGLGRIEVYGSPTEIDQHVSGAGWIKLK